MNLRAADDASAQAGGKLRSPAATVSALHQISSIAARATELWPALAEVLQILCELFGWPAGHALVSAPSQQLSLARSFFGDCPALREACEREPSPSPGAGAAFLDLAGDPRAAAATSCGVRASLVCPILAGGEAAGVLELFSPSVAPPDPVLLMTAEQAAWQLGRIVERLDAERKVQSGEDLFRAVCEALPVGVFLSDAQGNPVYTNPAFAIVCGFTVEEGRGDAWAQFLHPDDRERAVASWKKMLSSGEPTQGEYRFSRAGKERIVQAFVSPVPAPDQKPRGFVSLMEDLTTRRAAEEALRASEDRFRAIFEDAGVGLGIGTVDGHLVRVNPAYARFLGYEPDDLDGAHLRRVVADDLERSLHDRRELQSGRVSSYEVERQYLRRDGTKVWGRATVTRLGNTGLLVAVVQDIDARKRAEDAVRKLSGRLLRMQDDERRRIARSLHESAAQTVAALSMNLQRMERMELPAQSREALSDSLELVTQCSREIRTLSHLLHPPLLEEAGLPASLRWYVQGFAARSAVEVELHIADDIGRLPTDLEIALFRVVQESLTNVHRHSGSPSASIRLRRHGPEVVLEVEDRGVGVPPDMLGRVRMHAAAAIGVGIAGMAERLSQLGGMLELESSPQGTLVRARLRSDR